MSECGERGKRKRVEGGEESVTNNHNLANIKVQVVHVCT